MVKKIKILILAKRFDITRPKTRPMYESLKSLEKYAQVRYWHGRGNINDIIRKLRFTPDFILFHDLYSPIFSPKITGLHSVNIPKGCITIDVAYPIKIEKRRKDFNEHHIDLIFSVCKRPFLKVLPDYKKKFRWIPFSISSTKFKDYHLKKDIDFLLMGLVKERYPFREEVLKKMQGAEGFVHHPHPGHSTKDSTMINENFAKELNRSKIFFTCGGVMEYAVQKFFEAPACRTLLLAEPVPDLYDLGFEDGVHFVACNKDNLYEKAMYYIKNDKERQKITDQGYDLVHKYHTDDVRAQKMVRDIQIFLDMKKKQSRIVVEERNSTKNKRKPADVHFVTAAFGAQQHQFVKGLARTFSQSNETKLTVYTESKELRLPGCQMDRSITREDIRKGGMNLVRLSILEHSLRKHKHVCWINVNALIFTDLKYKIMNDHINIIGDPRGSALYSVTQKYLDEIKKKCDELRKEHMVDTNDICDLNIINNIVNENKHRIIYLNKEHPLMLWNARLFINKKQGNKSAHPHINNRAFCYGLKLKNDRLYHREIPFAVLHWTGDSLAKHIHNKFRNVTDIRARSYLRRLYSY